MVKKTDTETGLKMRALREKCGLSLRTVAKRMGFKSAQYISDLERGRRPWSESLIARFKKECL